MPASDLLARRRQELLTTASRVIAEHGYQETNVADIAGALGIGHGTFYRYFDSKRHIAEAVLDYAVDQVTRLVTDVDPDASCSLDAYDTQLATIGNRLFDFFLANRDLAAVFFVEAYGVDKELTARTQAVIELFGAYVERYLTNGVRKGFLRADLDIEITARAINGMIFAGALRTLSASDPESMRDRWIRAVSTLMLQGMAA